MILKLPPGYTELTYIELRINTVFFSLLEFIFEFSINSKTYEALQWRSPLYFADLAFYFLMQFMQK